MRVALSEIGISRDFSISVYRAYEPRHNDSNVDVHEEVTLIFAFRD